MLDVLIAVVLALPLWVVAMIWLDTVDPPKGLDVSDLRERRSHFENNCTQNEYRRAERDKR